MFPTLSLQNGWAVPLYGTVRSPGNPVELLERLIEQGCHRLALVDVDAAAGRGHNRDLIAALMRQFHRGNPKVCILVGGGIRSSDQAQYFLDQGATWIVVGTVIQRSPMVVDQLLARFRDHLTAGVDARSGQIQSSGWREPVPLTPESVGQRIRNHGFKRILFTDIPTTAQPTPDFQTARTLAQTARIPLFMGGSLQCSEHVKKALDIPGLQGVAVDALVLQENPGLLSSIKAV